MSTAEPPPLERQPACAPNPESLRFRSACALHFIVVASIPSGAHEQASLTGPHWHFSASPSCGPGRLGPHPYNLPALRRCSLYYSLSAAPRRPTYWTTYPILRLVRATASGTPPRPPSGQVPPAPQARQPQGPTPHGLTPVAPHPTQSMPKLREQRVRASTPRWPMLCEARTRPTSLLLA